MYFSIPGEDEIKAKFLANPKTNPELTYVKASTEAGDDDEQESTSAKEALDAPVLISDLTQKLLQLEALRDLIARNEVVYEDELSTATQDKSEQYDQVIRYLYVMKINEKIAEIRLILLSARAQQVQKSEISLVEKEHQIEILMKKFRIYSEFLYGKPSETMTDYIVGDLKKEITLCLQSENSELRSAAEELAALTTNYDSASEATYTLPSDETLEIANQETENEFLKLAEVEKPADPKYKYKAEEIKEIFVRVLTKLGVQNEWQVVIQSDNAPSSININQENKLILIPANKEISHNKIIKLIVHEIGTHIIRRINGEHPNSKLELLGFGLRGYKDDEGVATMREQAILDKVDDFRGLDYYLGIAIAQGKIDGKIKDFAGTFEVMKKYFLLSKLKSATDKSVAETKANESAWKICKRIFRGTTGTIPGVCFTKDLLYAHNADIWRLLGKHPGSIFTLNLGKFDPTNPAHIFAMMKLGVLEEDNEYLEKDLKLFSESDYISHLRV